MDELLEIKMGEELYQELFATEVDTYDGHGKENKQILAKALLQAKIPKWTIVLDDDGFFYFVNVVLPTNMEMWYTWNSVDGERLLKQAKEILNTFHIYYPY